MALKRYLPKSLLKICITSLSIAFVCISISKNFEKLIQQSLSTEIILLLILGFFISLLSLVVNALAWKELLIWLGFKYKNMRCINLYLRTNILKYVPGGIWHFFERFRVLITALSPAEAFSSVLLEPFLMLAASFFLVALCDWKNIFYFVFLLPSIFLARRCKGSLIMQLGAGKIMQFKEIGVNIAFTKDSINSSEPISPFPLRAFLIETCFVLLRFYAFWICLNAFSIESYFSFLEWISLFSLAWSIGLVIPSAPGGIGVFEAMILLFIPNSFPKEYILLVLLSYRLIISLADLAIPLFLASTSITKFKILN